MIFYGDVPVGDEASLVLFVSKLLTDNGGIALSAHQNALLRFVCRGNTSLLDAHPFTVLFAPLRGIDTSLPLNESDISMLLTAGLAAAGWIIPDPPTPLSIFSSVSVLQWCRADLSAYVPMASL